MRLVKIKNLNNGLIYINPEQITYVSEEVCNHNVDIKYTLIGLVNGETISSGLPLIEVVDILCSLQ